MSDTYSHEPDGCDIDFNNPAWNTTDRDVDALVMFADCFDDPAAIERRRVELIEWDEAQRGT